MEIFVTFLSDSKDWPVISLTPLVEVDPEEDGKLTVVKPSPAPEG